MGFEVGKLSAALTLEGVNEFHRDLDQAGRKLTETGQQGKSFGQNAEAAVRAAAGATTGLVAAAGAYLTILTKQGVAYNSLQQNSRAALKVLLGGAEQANAQMNKLDDFARNSPFSKSVFIQAQQQLIGFGMEAGKVIPTLDAIQQGVAAMGGSNEQISEVVNILANVNSTGKITAETFNQLGYRGIDGAELLGKAWGKTAAEIRDEVSKGQIDGKQAIDALVDSMQNRFGGAADNVKQQWSGAVDRIKAAQRDLGAHIAEPFVSAQGGGMAVTWGNQVADVLRAIEKQSVPVMETLTRRGMPFFAGLTQGLDSARMAVQRWDASKLEVSLDKLGSHAPGIAATAGAVLALGANVGPLGQMFKVLGISANPVLAAFVGLAAASPELRQALGELISTGKPLLPLLVELATIASGTLNSALPVVAGGVQLVTSVLGPLLGLVSSIPAPVLAGAAAFIAMRSGVTALTPAYHAVSGVVQSFHDQMKLQQHLAGMNTASMSKLGVATVDLARNGGRELGNFGAAAAVAGARVTGLGTAIKTAFLSNPIGIALTAVTAVVGAWAMANAAAEQRVQEHRDRVAQLKGTLNETSGATTEATRAMLLKQAQEKGALDTARDLGLSSQDLTDAMMGQENATHRVYSALQRWQKQTGSNHSGQIDLLNLVRESAAATSEGAEQTRRMTEEQRRNAAAMTDAARSNQRFNEALQVARDITQDAETRVRALKQALDELKGGAISAEEAQKRLSETNLSLAEGLAQADANGTKLWQSTLDGAGAIDIGSRAGLAFADTMGRSRDAMLDAARAASDQALANGDVAGAMNAAKSAGDGYIATLRQTMTEAGLTQEQINGLINKYLDVPSVVATLLTDEGSISETDQKVLQLAMKLDQLPEGENIEITEPMSPEIVKRLEALGYKVTHLPNGNIQVTETGSASVGTTIDAIARKRRVAYIEVQSTGDLVVPGAGGRLTKADGGVVQRTGSTWRDMKSFANGGGYPTGIYAGGPPLIKFAEPETGWEAFISGRKGQEARNARIAMDALDRLGFPVVPRAALQGMRAFANGGQYGAPAQAPTALSAVPAAQTQWNMTIVNPVVRDPFEQAWEEAQEKGAL